MTKRAKMEILSILEVVLGELQKREVSAEHPEDKQAFHGMASSVNKLHRRTFDKRSVEEKEAING